ncbi:uncharacterized protein LOC110721775 [Chenopodium quinoa]|uniref:uncharacterized protein LOC110721775 n=1 Tax=Chenopodium quinoa TaxID=63459 RepID=UPI000B792900|nr:uncharacterized protein LOC110721775 [Chenopodium quinoa]
MCLCCVEWLSCVWLYQFEFEVAMESINFLDEEAYQWLSNIDPQHWSRHAFSTNCKSNMLLNNMCETFNAVIRDARDKPILTQMEWLRRYMMKRSNDKWEAAKSWEGLLTPFVNKVFDGLEKYAMTCEVTASRDEIYEVKYKDDQCIVDLQERKCTCYRWELTGIPCVHAFACIMDKRDDPELYVHPHYYRVTYLAAYENPIQPMPGPKNWEKVKLRQPLPPMLKVQPGRPKAKKRKLEPGEGTSAAPEGKKPKVKKQCKNCGGFGHFAKTCKAEAAPEQPNPPATNLKGGRPQMQTPWLKEQRKKSEEKAARQAALKLPQYQPPTTAQAGSSNAAPATAVTSQPAKRTKPLPTQPVTRSNRSLSQPTRVPTTTPPKVKIQTRSKLHVMTSKKDKDLNQL